MQPLDKEQVEHMLQKFANKDVYIHLETTQGAYAVHHGNQPMAVGAYIRNAVIRYSRGKVAGDGPYRIGLKLEHGWVYAEGITDWEFTDHEQLLLAGHDPEGRLAVALQISFTPFE